MPSGSEGGPVRKRCNGSTFVEVLISLAILGTAGVFLLSFLHRNAVTAKAWHSDYATELSRETLLSDIALKDSTYGHIDANGLAWNTRIHVSKDGNEICLSAETFRSIDKDSSEARILHRCFYGDFQ